AGSGGADAKAREKGETGVLGARLPHARILVRKRAAGAGDGRPEEGMGRDLPLAGGQPFRRSRDAGRSQARRRTGSPRRGEPAAFVRQVKGNLSRRSGERSYAAVSFAYSSASHFIPCLPKLICRRASLPDPSALTMTPWPNFGCSTDWPMRNPWPGVFALPAFAGWGAQATSSNRACPGRSVRRFTTSSGSSSRKREATL